MKASQQIYRNYTARSYCGKVVKFPAFSHAQAEKRAKELLGKDAKFTLE